MREDVKEIRQATSILRREIHHYNYKQVHSTTGEVPYLRFQRALKEKQSLFREFKLVPPVQSIRDIFCLRIQRTADAYRKISINNLPFKVNGVSPGQLVTLRISPLSPDLCEVRFWCEDQLTDIQKIRQADLGLSTFNS